MLPITKQEFDQIWCGLYMADYNNSLKSLVEKGLVEKSVLEEAIELIDGIIKNVTAHDCLEDLESDLRVLKNKLDMVKDLEMDAEVHGE